MENSVKSKLKKASLVAGISAMSLLPMKSNAQQQDTQLSQAEKKARIEMASVNEMGEKMNERYMIIINGPRTFYTNYVRKTKKTIVMMSLLDKETGTFIMEDVVDLQFVVNTKNGAVFSAVLPKIDEHFNILEELISTNFVVDKDGKIATAKYNGKKELMNKISPQIQAEEMSRGR